MQNVVTKNIDFYRESSYTASMAKRGGAVHVVTTRRKYKGREYATHLLRRSYRDGGKVKAVPRDNQGENAATIRVRNGRRRPVEGRA